MSSAFIDEVLNCAFRCPGQLGQTRMYAFVQEPNPFSEQTSLLYWQSCYNSENSIKWFTQSISIIFQDIQDQTSSFSFQISFEKKSNQLTPLSSTCLYGKKRDLNYLRCFPTQVKTNTHGNYQDPCLDLTWPIPCRFIMIYKPFFLLYTFITSINQCHNLIYYSPQLQSLARQQYLPHPKHLSLKRPTTSVSPYTPVIIPNHQQHLLS